MIDSIRVIRIAFISQIRDTIVRNTFQFSMFVQPVLFTLLTISVYRFSGRTDLSLYGVIGAGMIGIWNVNLWTSGFIVDEERFLGTLTWLIAVPTSLEVVLLGKSLSNAVASLFSMFMAFATAAIVFRIPIGINNPIPFLIGLVLTVGSLTCLGLLLGTSFVLTRAAGQIAHVMNFPIYILSGLTFPITTLPLWTRPLSFGLAPMWGNEVLVRSASEASNMGIDNFVWSYVWLIGLSILYLVIAHKLYAVIERIVRQKGNLEKF